MPRKHNKSLLPFARELRKNMTKEERRLWYTFLNTYPVRFIRQKIIGSYIADFYCSAAKLVIEIDGSQHYSEVNIQYDKKRSAYFVEYGIIVIRIQNIQINTNFCGVCEYIDSMFKLFYPGRHNFSFAKISLI